MKRFIALALAATMALAPVSAFAINVRIDNTPLGVPASTINGRTMVPMRAIFEALGAEVAWNNTTKGITATKEDKTVNLYLNNKTAYIDGIASVLDAAPVTLDGRTMVPARFVAEAMGCTVGWDGATQTVNITTDGIAQPVKTNTYDVVRVVDGDTFVVDFNGTEEKVRLGLHIDYFLKTMEEEVDCGKKLGFIAQEMGREINTLGSKSNQADMQKIVVRMKDELEKIKEQSLNVL